MSTEITAEKLNEAFNKSNLTFRDRAATLAAFKQDREIIIDDESGQLFARYDAETLPLDECFLRFGLDNRQHIDGRSAPRNGSGGRDVAVTKSEMTTREKVAFIAQHGEEAFARIPSHPVATSEVVTKQDWMKLPLSEKVRRTKENPRAFEELPNANTGKAPGLFVDKAKLEKIKATRPASRSTHLGSAYAVSPMITGAK